MAIESPKQQKLESYQWLSKSSKRRVRKGMQKVDQKLKEKEGAAKEDADKNEEYHTPEGLAATEEVNKSKFEFPSKVGNVPKRIAQWRERKLERKTDPFTLCFGRWHHFACGHRISVLCIGCTMSWAYGYSKRCKRYAAARRAYDTGTQDEGDVSGINCHFELACPKCKAGERDVDLSYKKPWSGNLPHWKWEIAGFEPTYLSKESQQILGIHTQFYMISLDGFLLDKA
jgi:hypothetical protein